MVTIIFEAHATSLDNERQLSSGWNDVALSDLGREQARQLGNRYARDQFDAVYCSDLRRAFDTAEIAFGKSGWPIIRDARLRECDYGQLAGHPSAEVEAARARYVAAPFPGGESYEDTTRRIGEFLHELRRRYDGKRVLVIGHRATQYGLEHWIKNVAITDTITAPWKWRPGWKYELS